MMMKKHLRPLEINRHDRVFSEFRYLIEGKLEFREIFRFKEICVLNLYKDPCFRAGNGIVLPPLNSRSKELFNPAYGQKFSCVCLTMKFN